MESRILSFDSFPEINLRPVYGPSGGEPVDPVDPDVAKLLTETTARRTGLLPFARTTERIHVAISRPIDDQGLRALASLNQAVRVFRASPFQIQAAQMRVWPGDDTERLYAGVVPPVRPLHLHLGRILVDAGLLDTKKLYRALDRQAAEGGRLGELLITADLASPLAIAHTVALQHLLPLVNLQGWKNGYLEQYWATPRLFHTMPADFWRDHLLVPLALNDDELTVAMVNPDDGQAIQRLWAATGWRIRREVTRTRDIYVMLHQVYGTPFTEESRFGLLQMRPTDSAVATFSTRQRVWALVSSGGIAVGLVLWTLLPLIVLAGISQLFYGALTFFNLTLLARLASIKPGIDVSADELSQLDRRTLPIYTVLVPAHRETRILSTLARALAELDYPADRLDVKLLLDADDTALIDVARAQRLPRFIDITIVPVSLPRAKAKTCNYGLQLARGEYTVVFDATHIPEPDQLVKAVAAFRKAGPTTACVQAKLGYFNHKKNLLTRWISTESFLWFDLLLPSLHGTPVPIPLSGASSHFRTQVLRDLGAWDPYNGAAGADLGVRLQKSGYQTEIVDATTFDGATPRLSRWIRQRSRRIRGYLQTWLVHMRHPVALYRSLGLVGFVGFQLLIAGIPFILLLNPLYVLLTAAWCLTRAGVVQLSFPDWISYPAAGTILVGSFVLIYANMVAAARRNVWDLVIWSLLSPLYWCLLSAAAWTALWQLITLPSSGRTTDRGLTDAKILAEVRRRV